jgi:hypothetical protein
METTLPPEHAAARLGKLTASRISEAIAKTKSGWGASRANLMAELIAERLTGAQAQRFVSKEMLWGIETEPQARAAYEFYRDAKVDAMGFVPHPLVGMSGASPDGGVGEDGLIEIKCPNTATHIDYLLNDTVDKKYVDQMYWQMACTRRRWCDFVSFDPRMPPALQMRVTRFLWEDEIVTRLEVDATNFLSELAEKEIKLCEQIARAA